MTTDKLHLGQPDSIRVKLHYHCAAPTRPSPRARAADVEQSDQLSRLTVARKSVAELNPTDIASTEEGHHPFYHYPVQFSTAFRDALLAYYPALDSHPHARAYRRMVEYLLTSTYIEEQTGRLIVPARHIADIVREDFHAKAYSAIAWLNAFSTDVWPLCIHDYDRYEGLARTIERQWPDKVQRLLDDESLEWDAAQRVWFEAGTPVTRKKLYAEAATFTETLKEFADGVTADHPARGLMEFLNDNKQVNLGKTLQRNWPAVMQAYYAMPEETTHQRARKKTAWAVLQSLPRYWRVVYAPTGKSPRLYALSTTIHSLPREIRKIALAGCVSLDIRSAQLAIVCRLWEMPEMTAFLQTGRSIWAELRQWLGTDDDNKPLLKKTIYSIVFGMGEEGLRQLLIEGDHRLTGLSSEKMADKFFSHPLIRELLRCRNRRIAQIRRHKKITDAFGRAREYHRERARLRTLLAYEVQSYEIKLMLSLLPFLVAQRELHVVSFLHDGITLHVSDPSRRVSLIRRLIDTFNAAAQEMGISTVLEE